jgi:hypothetical protein
MDKIYKDFTGESLIKTSGLFYGYNTTLLPSIWSVGTTSPAMAIIEIALFDLLASVEIKPDILSDIQWEKHCCCTPPEHV